METIVYIQCEGNVICKVQDVTVSQVGTVWCEDSVVCAKCKAVKIHHFYDREFAVISVMKIIRKMTEACPGIRVISMGEEEIVLEPQLEREKDVPQKTKVWKVLFVSAILFFGTGFTIMAYQNDVGVNRVFAQVYMLLMGEESKGLNILQVSYAVGLFVGILLFFNHLGKRKLSSDPTPIQVSMRNYEDDVNKTLVQTAKREGKEEDV